MILGLTFAPRTGYNQAMTTLAPAIFPSAYGMRMCPNNFTVAYELPFPGRPLITIRVTQRDRGWYNAVETMRGKDRHYLLSYPEACRMYADAQRDAAATITVQN